MGPVRLATAAVLLCGLLMMRSSMAQDGTVTFTGAVTVPTCAADGVPATRLADASALSARERPPRLACADAARAATAVSHYRRRVTPSGAIDARGSPLLQYFVDTGAAAAPVDRSMVTRTYE